MRTAVVTICVMLSLLLSGQASPLDIDDTTSARNDRFANDASFEMANYDLSGIGRSSDGRWATLISRNVFVSAFHFHPGNGATITFYQTNDPSGPSITRSVIGGQRIDASDIWVGLLDRPVPTGYAVYPFATQNIGSQRQFSRSDYSGLNAFMIGQSPSGTFIGNQNVAVGRNVLSGYLGSVNASGTTDSSIYAGIEDETQDVQFEATLVGGDSGGPLLADFNENDNDFTLQIVGTNWFVATIGSPATDINGFTYLGNYDDQIQTFIDNNPAVDPDPSTFAQAYLAYRNSFFDTANSSTSIATDKTPLVAGQTAAFKNYTSYTLGINRLLIDIQDLPNNGLGISADDFVFRVGNDSTPSDWTNAPAPTSITVLPGQGTNGSDRVVIDWPNNAIQSQWLQATILSTDDTNLTVDSNIDTGIPDTLAGAQFYYGNARYDSGLPNTQPAAEVTFTDAINAFLNQTLAGDAIITNPYDYNRDGIVNFTDAINAFLNQTTPATALQLITPPTVGL